ncbi:MAG: hypothetical protein CMF52_08230 [Legionellales bacterium]|nr:hypothetical protein [Legionellales bacterium]HAV93550.1 hypothetical protein [Pseudomonadota bacterium]
MRMLITLAKRKILWSMGAFLCMAGFWVSTPEPKEYPQVRPKAVIHNNMPTLQPETPMSVTTRQPLPDTEKKPTITPISGLIETTPAPCEPFSLTHMVGFGLRVATAPVSTMLIPISVQVLDQPTTPAGDLLDTKAADASGQSTPDVQQTLNLGLQIAGSPTEAKILPLALDAMDRNMADLSAAPQTTVTTEVTEAFASDLHQMLLEQKDFTACPVASLAIDTIHDKNPVAKKAGKVSQSIPVIHSV